VHSYKATSLRARPGRCACPLPDAAAAAGDASRRLNCLRGRGLSRRSRTAAASRVEAVGVAPASAHLGIEVERRRLRAPATRNADWSSLDPAQTVHGVTRLVWHARGDSAGPWSACKTLIRQLIPLTLDCSCAHDAMTGPGRARPAATGTLILWFAHIGHGRASCRVDFNIYSISIKALYLHINSNLKT